MGKALLRVFGLKTRKEKDRLVNLGVVGGTILKWIFKKQCGGVESIRVVQRRDKERNFCENDDETSS